MILGRWVEHIRSRRWQSRVSIETEPFNSSIEQTPETAPAGKLHTKPSSPAPLTENSETPKPLNQGIDLNL